MKINNRLECFGAYILIISLSSNSDHNLLPQNIVTEKRTFNDDPRKKKLKSHSRLKSYATYPHQSGSPQQYNPELKLVMRQQAKRLFPHPLTVLQNPMRNNVS